MKRVPQIELLDTDNGTPNEITASLRDLRFINRVFGGIGTSSYMLRHSMGATGQQSASVLEVAAGDGFAITATAAALRRSGLAIHVTALDRQLSHVNGSGLPTVIGDALAVPFADSSFDFVSCALFLHHLSPAAVVRFVTEGLRVARRGVLINDLLRSRLHLGLVYLGLPLFRSRITHHDGPASVRQSYTMGELNRLLRQTPARRVELHRRYLYRVAAIAWK